MLVCMKRQFPFRRLFPVALAALLGLAAAAAAGDVVNCRPGSTPAEIAASLLPARAELAHPPVQVALPPSPKSLVVLYRAADGVDSNYHGWVLVPAEGQCAYTRYALPEMDEAPTLFEIEVKSVFGANVGTKKPRALVVLYKYHRSGSEENSGYASYVYRWSGNGFESLTKTAEKLVGLKTAQQVRNKLRVAR